MYERMTLTKYDEKRDGNIKIVGTYTYEESETRGEGSCEIEIPESYSFEIEKIEYAGIDVTSEYDKQIGELSDWCLENLPE